jgi:hypothetical protein
MARCGAIEALDHYTEMEQSMKKQYSGLDYWIDADDNEYEFYVTWEWRCERDIDVDEWVFVDAELVDRAELSDLEMATAMDVMRQSPPAFMEECE